uniref:RNA helicase n=2 Tax=Meloidogyne TaxID=189290 RepID=A0A914LHU4_MELIC
MFIVKSNLSSLFLRQPRISFCVSVANYYGGDRPQYGYGDRPQYDNQQRYQNRENRSEGYGDQRPYYIQNLRNTKRVGGDAQFYQNRGPYRPNVSGYGGNRMTKNSFAGNKLRPVDWNKHQLPEIKKDLYKEHENVTNRELDAIKEWLKENECIIRGQEVPRPIFEFIESGFPEPIINLLLNNYESPMSIQCISWPVALSGRDMISISRTGSGKTLGFILPAIMHAISQPPRRPGDGPSVLVLLPTRELALQVQEVANEFCKIMNLTAFCCYGGASKVTQGNILQRGVDICIATPGRCLDFLEAKVLNLNKCTFLVLDEADRMLDMGFEPQIRSIIGQLRNDRQTLMFSATWPKEVRELANDFHKDPVHLTVGSLELAANHNIEQYVEVVDEREKEEHFMELLGKIIKEDEYKTLIFVATKRKADDLTRNLRRDGVKALCIHGDKSQTEREWVLSEFKSNRMPILIATDVAARGLDVDDIKYVINYDYPNNSKDYIHRIGRTGRRNKTGVSYTFFTPEESDKAKDLIEVLEEAKQTVPDSLRSLAENGNRKGGGQFGGRPEYRAQRGYY